MNSYIALGINSIKRCKPYLLVLAGVGTVLGGLSGYLTAYHALIPSTSSITQGVTPLNADQARSILVLPFSSLNAQPGQDYFADGLTAKLTSDLSRISGSMVIATTTAMTFKDKKTTVQQIGHTLGVRYVLQGDVQRSGTTLRVNASLADTRSGLQLWAETFDGQEADLFGLQDQITARIANSIGREIVVVAVRESDARKGNVRAVDLMLHGIALADKPGSLDRLMQQEKYFREALVLEPDNVDAMARLSRALVLQKINFGGLLSSDLADQKLKEGYELAQKAKDLDPNNPRAELTIGLVFLSKGDISEGIRALEAGIALDRNNPLLYLSLANAYILLGETGKALELAERAIRRDPLGPGNSAAMYFAGLASLYSDNIEAATEWFLKAQAANPSQPRAYAALAVAYARSGNLKKAQEYVMALQRMAPNFSLKNSPEHPFASSPEKYKHQYQTIYLPAARQAGLPE
ncbi:MAG: hypothetical protein NVSMB6_27820 [Burkholderiaceae bacterium]